jgi:predicted RNA binding protein YcfA (HicA-like mRNA interferase family)
MPPKIRDVLQQLKDVGWQQVSRAGSYRQFKHSVYPSRVTVVC